MDKLTDKAASTRGTTKSNGVTKLDKRASDPRSSSQRGFDETVEWLAAHVPDRIGPTFDVLAASPSWASMLAGEHARRVRAEFGQVDGFDALGRQLEDLAKALLVFNPSEPKLRQLRTAVDEGIARLRDLRDNPPPPVLPPPPTAMITELARDLGLEIPQDRAEAQAIVLAALRTRAPRGDGPLAILWRRGIASLVDDAPNVHAYRWRLAFAERSLPAIKPHDTELVAEPGTLWTAPPAPELSMPTAAIGAHHPRVWWDLCIGAFEKALIDLGAPKTNEPDYAAADVWLVEERARLDKEIRRVGAALDAHERKTERDLSATRDPAKHLQMANRMIQELGTLRGRRAEERLRSEAAKLRETAFAPACETLFVHMRNVIAKLDEALDLLWAREPGSLRYILVREIRCVLGCNVNAIDLAPTRQHPIVIGLATANYLATCRAELRALDCNLTVRL